MKEQRKELIKHLMLREKLSKRILELGEEYIDTQPDSYIFITEHAIVRYIERVLGHEVHGSTDIEKVDNYIASIDITGQEFRNSILTQQEMKNIVLWDMRYYKRDNIKFVIRNLAVITVLNMD